MRPCKAERPVTTPFGQKGDAWSTGEHGGIDYGCPTGDPVYAMWGGTVIDRSWGSAYGTHVVIDHDKLPNGDPGLWAAYCHMKSKTTGPGDYVKAGELIGYSDNTGNSSGPHLHVEVQPQSGWVKGSYVNPQPWIDAGTTDTGGEVWTDYSGKPSGTLTISNAQDYVSMDFVTEDPPSSGLEFHLLYVNCEIAWGGDDMGIIRVKYRRDDGDDTAYQDYCVPKGAALGSPDTFLLTATHWEAGEKGKGGRWYLRCEGGISSVKLNTRYCKIAVMG